MSILSQKQIRISKVSKTQICKTSACVEKAWYILKITPFLWKYLCLKVLKSLRVANFNCCQSIDSAIPPIHLQSIKITRHMYIIQNFEWLYNKSMWLFKWRINVTFDLQYIMPMYLTHVIILNSTTSIWKAKLISSVIQFRFLAWSI